MSDFDFLIGTWTVTNRRRRAFLAGVDEWEVYPATSVSRSILGGGNIDEIDFPTKGTRGLTLRLFDAERKQWSLYWASSAGGALDPPVVGGFTGDRGDFYGDDVYDGKPIRVHYIWTGTTTGTPRWEQEFSADGGRTWESNWTMDFAPA